ncbi:uncharacterized protein LOC129353796 [Poeciliopsis prolifica]|uniref:uncharacterized protein LOC129353796 n=1 Tax=Poeciliopsis prolifica TaxID=188132 RepID=UPI00241458C3|nr:uncharacterized protein LOC129353796 [Poeciliopsis prolifica]
MIMMMMMILLLVSQHALGGVVEVNQGAESVLLPCIYFGFTPDEPLLIWTRSYLSPNSVHLRRENGDDLKNQNQRFRNRTSMNPDALDSGDFSLTLRKPQQSDGGNYTCSIFDGREELNLKQIHLKVKADQQEVEVTEGSDSVVLPCRILSQLPEDTSVEWTRSEPRSMFIHVFPNTSKHYAQQDRSYSCRTEMKKDFLRTGDVSLTLMYPTHRDDGRYVCTVYRGQDVLRHTVVLKYFKVDQQEVKVTEGSDSVVLPCTTSSQLPEDTSVEWTRSEPEFMMVHSSSNQRNQDKLYRHRTEMKKDFLRTGDVSLTLRNPRDGDDGRYVCTVYRGQDVLRHTVRVRLPFLCFSTEHFPSWAKALLVLLVLLVLVLIVSAGALYHFKDHFLPALQVKVDSGVKSVLLPCRTNIYLPGDARVEWKNGENKTVHVYPNGSDDPEEQNLTSRTRMGDDPLKTKDLSLTLDRPSVADSGIYTCRVSIRKRVILVMKRVHLQVKDIVGQYQPDLKESLKMKIQSLSEGVAELGNKTDLNQIYTELYITEGSTREVNQE